MALLSQPNISQMHFDLNLLVLFANMKNNKKADNIYAFL